MSTSTLFNSNDYNLNCNNLSVAGSLSVAGEVSAHQTVNLTYTGPFTAAQQGVCHLSKVGKSINITFDQVVSAANTASVITSTAIPAAYWPSNDIITQYIAIENNSAGTFGVATLSNTGILTIAVGLAGNFANTGNCGFFTFAYGFAQQ